LTSIDINGSLPVFQWFLDNSIASWSSNPQVMGSSLKKFKIFKKKIVGSYTRQSEIERRFAVEIDIFS
jgi:hypothetical protein